ncbi:hypothetical protein [Streptomyces sp. NPDC002855]|uniref:hypothetical protein n=1 Tax=Streptomyces sp. NPDC002855 TaxID=3154437 RepID=UPI003318C8FF
MTRPPRRGTLTPEQRKEANRIAKRSKYFRAIGKPLRVYPWEAEAALKKISTYHDDGMSYESMARASGVSRGALHELVRGVHRTVMRDSYDAIMAMQFEPPATWRESTRVPSLGTERRLQALWADGWPTKELAPMLNMTRQNFMGLVKGQQQNVTHIMHVQVAALYDKLAGTNPEDHGITYWATCTAKTWAAKRDYAPSHCWDYDTIDNPEAFPQWTGECGTAYGASIHLREDIPLCPPCRAARNEQARESKETRKRGGQTGKRQFAIQRYARIRELAAEGHTREYIQNQLGIGERTYYRAFSQEDP